MSPTSHLDAFHRMDGRTCLVTGATSGHGRAVAGALAARGADVVLLARNAALLDETAREIAASTGRRPEILRCDLASRADIDRAASEYLASARPLHVLVNNAGMVSRTRELTVDGVERVFAVNYLAYFQLTLRLLPRLRESAPARVVNVSSDTHRIVSLDLDDLELRDGFSWLKSYGRSKLAIVHFTAELARRLAGSGVTVNALDPGPVRSNIGSHDPSPIVRTLGRWVMAPFPSAARAARTAIYLASAPELASVTGAYYKFGTRREPHWGRGGPAVSTRLWEASVRYTGADLGAAS
ncbi:MAG: SDR family NAD(P)-dependent oxidoreductase [bacterium]